MLYMRLCFLCYHGEGKTRKAVGYYKVGNKVFDVCRKHRKLVRDQGLMVFDLPEKERIMEV